MTCESNAERDLADTGENARGEFDQEEDWSVLSDACICCSSFR